MSETEVLPVVAIGRGPVDLEGGRVLAHGERADTVDNDRTRALIAAGHLVIDEAIVRDRLATANTAEQSEAAEQPAARRRGSTPKEA